MPPRPASALLKGFCCNYPTNLIDLLLVHLAISPALKISNGEPLKKRVCVGDLLARRAACGIRARHDGGGICAFRGRKDRHSYRGASKMCQIERPLGYRKYVLWKFGGALLGQSRRDFAGQFGISP